MFIENTIALEVWKKVQEHNDHIAVLVAKACKTILEPHIPEEAPLEAKIRQRQLGFSLN